MSTDIDMRIWKFPLAISGTQKIEMPRGAKILALQLQHGRLNMWALMDSQAPREYRCFDTYGTGHPLPDHIDAEQYIGTYQAAGGEIIFHVFERTKE